MKAKVDKINWFNDFYSDMFSLTFFSLVDSKSFLHFVIDTILIFNRTEWSTIQEVIMVVISS